MASNLAPGRIALVLSLVLHLGAGVAFTRARLSPGTTLPKAIAESERPYTPKTFGSKLEEAKERLQKLSNVANKLETLKRETPQQAPSKPAEDAAKLEESAKGQSQAMEEIRRARAARPGGKPLSPREALVALEKARAAQTKAFLAQDKIHQQLLRPTEKPKSAPQERALASVKRSLERQAAAQAALRQAREALQQAMQARTLVVGKPASEAMKAAQIAQQEANAARKIATEDVRVARYDREKTDDVANHPSGPKNRRIVAYTRVEERAALPLLPQERAQQQLKSAKEALKQGKPGEAKRALDAAGAVQREARDAQADARKTLERDGETIPGKADSQQEALASSRAAQTKAEKALEAARSAVSRKSSDAAEALEKALTAQEAATEKQRETLDSLKGVFNTERFDPKHKHGPECFRPGGVCSPFGGAGGKTLKSEDGKELADALLGARAAEAKIQSLYRSLKGGPATATPSTDALSEALQRSGSGAPASAINAAEQEIEAISARAQRLLDQAQGQPGTQASVFMDKMTVLASQDMGGHATDLSGLMTGGEGSGRTSIRRAQPGDPSSGSEIGNAPPVLGATVLANAVPGRRIMGDGGKRPTWMFIDSWYVVGPFPNPKRANLRTRFGPEDVVDLDATYSGMGGRTLRWKFWQTNTPRVVPPDAREYAIYYLFTELYSDRERDLWLAVGSDDQSNLWINEQLVWMSSELLKQWQAGEGMRRVHLKKGRNRILLRLENGWMGTDTSLLFSFAT